MQADSAVVSARSSECRDDAGQLYKDGDSWSPAGHSPCTTCSCEVTHSAHNLGLQEEKSDNARFKILILKIILELQFWDFSPSKSW